MSTYKFAMEGSTGKTTRYEAYLKDGKLVDVTKLGAKEIRMSFSYGQRLYAAAKKGMFSLSHARGHEEDIKSDVIRKRYRGRGQPKKPSVKHAKQSRQSKTSAKTWAVKRSIGIALNCYQPNTGWDYGGYKQASEVYRQFRDVYDGDAEYNPTVAIEPISMCEGRVRAPRTVDTNYGVYAWVVMDNTVSGDDNEDLQKRAMKMYWRIDGVSWADMCHLKYTIEELDVIFHNIYEVEEAELDGTPVTMIGLCAYDNGFVKG